jgi:hypothetical protein
VRRPAWLVPLVLTGLLAGQLAPALAHEVRPALLALREVSPGSFTVAWHPPAPLPGHPPVVPRFPPGCSSEASRLVCPGASLTGNIRLEGIEASPAEVLVQIQRLDGGTRTDVLRARKPEISLGAGGPTGSGRTGRAALAFAYLRMGWQHILAGFDHLLFVVALVLLVGFSTRLLWTITAFTAAHSLTLAASVLGFVSMPAGAVEIVIALSIVLVALECLHNADSFTRRHPWAVSFGFGLLHGFGFAGALAEIGLPPGQVPLALLCFNLGVELGQLVAVAALFVAHRMIQRWPGTHQVRLAMARTATVYVIGTLAAYWTLDRAVQAWM